MRVAFLAATLSDATGAPGGLAILPLAKGEAQVFYILN